MLRLRTIVVGAILGLALAYGVQPVAQFLVNSFDTLVEKLTA